MRKHIIGFFSACMALLATTCALGATNQNQGLARTLDKVTLVTTNAPPPTIGMVVQLSTKLIENPAAVLRAANSPTSAPPPPIPTALQARIDRPMATTTTSPNESLQATPQVNSNNPSAITSDMNQGLVPRSAGASWQRSANLSLSSSDRGASPP